MLQTKDFHRYNIYCAAGWFTSSQVNTYDKVHEILDEYKDVFNVYYPKEQFQLKTGTKTRSDIRKKVFNDNIRAINKSDLIVCSTEGKDMGSIFEAGCAYTLSKPIIYVCFSLGNKPLNLMLQETSLAVATNPHTLEQILHLLKEEGIDSPKFKKYLHQGLTE